MTARFEYMETPDIRPNPRCAISVTSSNPAPRNSAGISGRHPLVSHMDRRRPSMISVLERHNNAEEFGLGGSRYLHMARRTVRPDRASSVVGVETSLFDGTRSVTVD